MQELSEGCRISLRCLLPVKPLAVQVYGVKDGFALAPFGLSDFLFFLLPLPPPLHIGLIGEVGFIDEQDRQLTLGLFGYDLCNDLVHPFFFTAPLGAWAGIVLAKRLYTQPPRLRALLTVLGLAWRSCWRR